jgi:hypothetical protein
MALFGKNEFTPAEIFAINEVLVVARTIATYL